jgi:acetate kinase
MTSHVLVINAGSSSLKYSLVDGETGESPASGSVERIGESSGRLAHEVGDEEHTEEREFATFEDALGAVVEAFDDHGPRLGDIEVVAVGHRVVHGGEQFVEPTLVDDDVVAAVEGLVPLAPLHNPANLEGIAVAR